MHRGGAGGAVSLALAAVAKSGLGWLLLLHTVWCVSRGWGRGRGDVFSAQAGAMGEFICPELRFGACLRLEGGTVELPWWGTAVWIGLCCVPTAFVGSLIIVVVTVGSCVVYVFFVLFCFFSLSFIFPLLLNCFYANPRVLSLFSDSLLHSSGDMGVG